MKLRPEDCLPEDAERATLLGRAWVPGDHPGPSPVIIRGGDVVDISDTFPTMSELLNTESIESKMDDLNGTKIGVIDSLLENSVWHSQDKKHPYLLAPVDLQAVKACGVTFAQSMLERVIEERAKGDPSAAQGIRNDIKKVIGLDLESIIPGSSEAEKLKEGLIKKDMWSQYLEVGIGPDAEVFTKAQPMSVMGIGAQIGILEKSEWNNPEPEITLAVNARGKILGAALANDVNLRDIEGRSALLLGKAKDNNASAAIGPFIRLFDENFSLDDVRMAELSLTVKGVDQFTLHRRSSMSKISRDVTDLVDETIGKHDQYPHGFCLMTGTLFEPSEDRDKIGGGFTHKVGDLVQISTPTLGALVNEVELSENLEPWEFGAGALMKNLAARGLL